MKIDWEAIKSEYVSGAASLSALSKKHKISYDTLKKRSAKERWRDEKAKAKERAKEITEAVTASVSEAQTAKRTKSLDKIYRCAEKLLRNIDEYSEVYITPDNVNAASRALKTLKEIVCDVDEIQSVTERQRYELAKEKLEIERQRAHLGSNDDEAGGVVMLPDVKADE